jgi:ethanolamine ammonia-lyase large subunit
MLNYQSTSFHDALFARKLLGRKRAPEFEAWLHAKGITDEHGALRSVTTLPALARAMSQGLLPGVAA